MPPRRLIAFFSTVLTLLGAPAIAQTQSAIEILDASRDALHEISGLSAQFRMKGEGGSMFASTLPSMSGQLFFGTNEQYGRVIHCIGEARDQQTSPTVAIDLLIAPDRYLWTDTKARTIFERPVSGSSRGLLSAVPFVLMNAIVADDPFAKDANSAQSIELLAQETISDVLCDVIQIKRAKPKSRANRSGSDSYTDVRWFIGTKDKLPRKVEHITDAGLVKISLLFELSNLKIVEPTQDQLDIARPDGFAFKSTMPKPRDDSASDQNPDDLIDLQADPSTSSTPFTTPATNPNTEPIAPRSTRAPGYAFTTNSGAQINNASQAGRVTVLYFWGSWCVPCITASPLVSSLAEEFASDPVDIFGLAIREADPDRAIDEFESKGYHHTLVLDGSKLVLSLKVRVFPTIAIIDQSGEIVFEHSITKDLGVEDLVAQSKEAITKALGHE